MSNTTAHDLPDPQTAYDTLFQNVHARVFFDKCAAAGYVPRSEQEASWMLEVAGKMRTLAESEQVKQAGVQDNPYYQMNADLDRLMARYGVGPAGGAAPAQQAEVMFKQAAAHYMQDPHLYNAVLALKVDEAQAAGAAYEQWRRGQGN